MTNDDSQQDIEQLTAEFSNQSRARAIQSLLVEKGLLSTDAVDEIISVYERQIGPVNGARIVARAWTDEDYRKRLLDDATAAASELGIDVEVHNVVLEAVENTEDVHNLVVCTLCSCYPWAILGLPPTWYKSQAYRARAVREPVTLLREDFDLDLGDKVTVRVWDSTSELRYFVLPQRPPGTEEYTEEELVELVSRDAMIGVDRLSEAPAADGGTAATASAAETFGVPLDKEPTFHAPWQARAFAVSVALTDDLYPWEAFQSNLVDAIDKDVGTSTDTEERYYEQWLDALERLFVEREYVTPVELKSRAGEFESGDRTAEEWIEGHHGHEHGAGHNHAH
jgi:nitrile hydratase alpha subunit/nitrile hydratase accessory protein